MGLIQTGQATCRPTPQTVVGTIVDTCCAITGCLTLDNSNQVIDFVVISILLAVARQSGLKQNMSCESQGRVTFSCSNLSDMTHSIIVVHGARVQLTEWWVTLYLCVGQYGQVLETRVCMLPSQTNNACV